MSLLEGHSGYGYVVRHRLDGRGHRGLTETAGKQTVGVVSSPMRGPMGGAFTLRFRLGLREEFDAGCSAAASVIIDRSRAMCLPLASGCCTFVRTGRRREAMLDAKSLHTGRSEHRPSLEAADTVFEAKRTGLARSLFAILHPHHARAASVNAEAVRLLFGSRCADISLGDVEVVDVADGRPYSSVRVRHTAGEAHVSGLPRMDANALADALETARCDWWRRTLAPHLQTLRSVHDRLTALADPSRYLTADALRDLEAEAQTVAGGLAARWPEALSDAPEVRLLRGILGFLNAPGDAKAKANEAFVVNELVRSRGFFDRIEARPLTEEQRRAVVVDERRNLVVAAAGSGKTSVIVAKTGWLVRKGVSQAVRTAAARLRARCPQGDGRADGRAPRHRNCARRDSAYLPQPRHGDRRQSRR